MREIRTSGATRGAGELQLLPPTLPVILGCGIVARYLCGHLLVVWPQPAPGFLWVARSAALCLHDRDELRFDGATGNEERFLGHLNPDCVLVDGVGALERADRRRQGKVTHRGRAFEVATGVGHLRSDFLDESGTRAGELELESALRQSVLVSFLSRSLGGSEEFLDVGGGQGARANLAQELVVAELHQAHVALFQGLMRRRTRRFKRPAHGRYP